MFKKWNWRTDLGYSSFFLNYFLLDLRVYREREYSLTQLPKNIYFVKIQKNRRGAANEGEYFPRMKCQNPPHIKFLETVNQQTELARHFFLLPFQLPSEIWENESQSNWYYKLYRKRGKSSLWWPMTSIIEYTALTGPKVSLSPSFKPKNILKKKNLF